MTASEENETVAEQRDHVSEDDQSENRSSIEQSQVANARDNCEESDATEAKSNGRSTAKEQEHTDQDDQQNGSSDETSSGSNGTAEGKVKISPSFLSSQKTASVEPAKITDIPIGDSKIKAKLRFEVVTARVIEQNGKKHVVGVRQACQMFYFV